MISSRLRIPAIAVAIIGTVITVRAETGAGFHFGLAMPDDLDAGFCLGGHLDFIDVVPSVPGLGFEARLTMWFSDNDYFYGPAGFHLDNDYFTCQITGGPKYIFPVEKSPVLPYIALDMGFFITNWNGEWYRWDGHEYDIYDDSDTDLDFGMMMAFGVEIPFNKKFNGRIELGYSADGIETGYLLFGGTFILGR